MIVPMRRRPGRRYLVQQRFRDLEVSTRTGKDRLQDANCFLAAARPRNRLAEFSDQCEQLPAMFGQAGVFACRRRAVQAGRGGR